MADEQQTDETNSEPATQTVASAEKPTPSSTTGETEASSESQQGQPNDPLNDGGLLDGTSDGEGDGPAALIGAPEGDYELALPDDAPFTIAAEDVAALTPLAKELNLSNAGLSRLAMEGVPLIHAAAQRAMVADVIDTRKAWEADARALVQGGKLQDGTVVQASSLFHGENMDAVTSTAARAIDRFTNGADGQPMMFPAARVGEDGTMQPGTFRDFLKTTGIGNHPAMVQAFYMAGKLLGEDSDFERGGGAPQSKLSREDKYYPHQATA